MKNVLSKLIVAVMVLSLVAASFGQAAGPRPGQGGGGSGRVQFRNDPEMAKKIEAIKKKVATELKLTTDQVNKLKALDKKQSDKVKAFRDKNQGKQPNRDTMMAEFKKIRDAYDKEIKTILGTKAAKYQQRMREETMKLRGGPGGTRVTPGKTGSGSKAGGGKAGGKG